jgi:adenylosuccinate synthase
VRRFEELPANARRYVERVEELVGVPVKHVSVGPAREAIVRR